MSGDLTPCRQLRPSSRREHVSASNSQMGEKTRCPGTLTPSGISECASTTGHGQNLTSAFEV